MHASKVNGIKSLLGSSPVEMAQVDQWCQYIRTETLPLVNALKMFTFGLAQCDTELFNQLSNEYKDNAKVLNGALSKTQYLVGSELTIADLLFSLSQVEMQQALMEVNLRNSMQHINTAFKRTCEMAEWRSRLGNIKQGKK